MKQKKILFILAAVILLMTARTFGDEGMNSKDDKDLDAMSNSLSESAPSPNAPAPTVAPVMNPPAQNPPAAASSLVNMDLSRLKDRIDELERKVSELKQENHLQDDRIRSLDRSIDSVKRRV